jgi:hypothetical protein
MNEDNYRLLDTIRGAFGRVVYTYKTHQKMADRLAFRDQLVKVIELILISSTAGTTISVIFGSGRTFQVVSAVLASLSLLVTIYQYRFNLEQIVQQHRTCANKLWLIREKYTNLLCDLYENAIDLNLAREKRDALMQEVSAVYDVAPGTDSKSYEQARIALKVSEELTFSDEEIDQLLPESLQKIKAKVIK